MSFQGPNSPQGNQQPLPQQQPQNPQHQNQPFQNQQFQASPPAPQKNWFARHKVLTAIIAIFVGVLVLANLGGGSDEVTPATESSPATETSSPAEPEDDTKPKDDAQTDGDDKATESQEPAESSESASAETQSEEPKAQVAQQFKIGDKAKAGDVVYKVTGIDTAASVGPEFMAETAKGKYLIVTVAVTNNGNESITITDSFFKLKAGDKVFEADSMATLTANSDNDGDSFFYDDLNPDLTATGMVIFDVSEKTAKAKDNLLQAQTGFWGTETVEILLSK